MYNQQHVISISVSKNRGWAPILYSILIGNKRLQIIKFGIAYVQTPPPSRRTWIWMAVYDDFASTHRPANAVE